MRPNNKPAHIIGSISRTLLALTFLVSGFVKAVDPLGTVYKIEDYLVAFGGWFMHLLPLAEVAAVLLIGFEFVMGFCMLLNVRTSWTSWLSLLFYLVMTPLTLWIARTNPVTDCGCFGDAIILTNWQTFWKNIILLALVIILLICRKAIPQLFSWWAELILALLGAGIAFGIMEYSYTHLPPIDFRPFKVGNNIIELMEVPEDAPQDIYDVKLIYERDGVQKEFSLTDYPKGDSTWTFVEQRSELVKKGYEAPIHNFEIMTLDYEDITYDVLESEKPVTLITMYDLNKTDRSQIQNLAVLCFFNDLSIEKVYFLTGSGEDEIYAFAKELGMNEEEAREIFCTMDPITIKTMVRANPGMIVIQNGIVKEKRNLKQY